MIMNHLGHFIVGQIIRTCFDRNITMNTPTPEEIKAAREAIDAGPDARDVDLVYLLGQRHLDTIDFALRFTEKMMGNPSEAMCDAGMNADDQLGQRTSRVKFKAMRDQAIKEISE